MTSAADRCAVHETPQPSLCLRCNRDNRDEWGHRPAADNQRTGKPLMPQKHDQGWKKQQPAALPKPSLDTERLARELVENGLASPQILDPRATFNRRKEPTA